MDAMTISSNPCLSSGLAALLAEQKGQLSERQQAVDQYKATQVPENLWQGFWCMYRPNVKGFRDIHISQIDANVSEISPSGKNNNTNHHTAQQKLLGVWREDGVTYFMEGMLSPSQRMMEGATVHALVVPPSSSASTSVAVTVQQDVSSTIMQPPGYSSNSIHVSSTIMQPPGVSNSMQPLSCSVHSPILRYSKGPQPNQTKPEKQPQEQQEQEGGVKAASAYQKKIMEDTNVLQHTTLAKKFVFPISLKMGAGHRSIQANMDWRWLNSTSGGTDCCILSRQHPAVVAVYTTNQQSETGKDTPSGAGGTAAGAGTGSVAGGPAASVASGCKSSVMGGGRIPSQASGSTFGGGGSSAFGGKSSAFGGSSFGGTTAQEDQDGITEAEINEIGEVRTRKILKNIVAPVIAVAQGVVDIDRGLGKKGETPDRGSGSNTPQSTRGATPPLLETTSGRKGNYELAPITSSSDLNTKARRTVLKSKVKSWLEGEDLLTHWCEGGLYNNDEYACVTKDDVERVCYQENKFCLVPTTFRGVAQIRQQKVHALFVHVEILPPPVLPHVPGGVLTAAQQAAEDMAAAAEERRREAEIERQRRWAEEERRRRDTEPKEKRVSIQTGYHDVVAADEYYYDDDAPAEEQQTELEMEELKLVDEIEDEAYDANNDELGTVDKFLLPPQVVDGYLTLQGTFTTTEKAAEALHAYLAEHKPELPHTARASGTQ